MKLPEKMAEDSGTKCWICCSIKFLMKTFFKKAMLRPPSSPELQYQCWGCVIISGNLVLIDTASYSQSSESCLYQETSLKLFLHSDSITFFSYIQPVVPTSYIESCIIIRKLAFIILNFTCIWFDWILLLQYFIIY